MTKAEPSPKPVTLHLPIMHLTSKSGRPYIGCDVPKVVVQPFLDQLLAEEASDFASIRQNQRLRDRGCFHVTAISPPELEAVGKKFPNDILGQQVALALFGLGKAVWEGQRSFFVVVQSNRISDIRRDLGLGKRDLHITLGFDQSDVQNVSKDESSLL